MDLGGVIDSLATHTLQVTRLDAGTYVDGRYVEDPAPTTVPIDALVVPAKPDDLERLSEGRRKNGAKVILTKELLRTAQVNGPQADRFDLNGSTYEIEAIDPWGDVAGYLRAIAVRLGQ